MQVKKSVLGLLNSVTSAQEKYLSSIRGSEELVYSMTGGGAFSNSDHLWTLNEERCERNKSWDVAYKSRLKGLVSNLQGTDKCLLLHTKSTGA